jgi:ABC-type transport system substrate-binding protein
VFVPNPYYYDKSRVKFTKVTVNVITNPQTALNSLRSGENEFVSGDFATAQAAEAAGLKVYSTPYGWAGLSLLDRDGALVPALKSQAVRQAMNYALDREGITKAIYGKYGTPNDEIAIPGYESQGYDPDYVDHYKQDVQKAKDLLRQAGFAGGFQMTIGASPDFAHGVELAQAIANDWEKIGIKTKIQTYPSLSQLVAAWAAKKLPATAGDYGAQPLFIMSQQLLAKDAGLYNPFQNVDSELSALIEKAAAATDKAEIASGWAAVTRRVVDLGWQFPVATESKVYFARPSLKTVELSSVAFAPNPTLWSH